MHNIRYSVPVMFLLFTCLVWARASAAESIFAAPPMTQSVNVNVGFNTQIPLPDLSQDALAATQRAGREYLYRSARDECPILKATIAETCRLTGMNLNTRIQQQAKAQPILYISGNANFAITLKDDSNSGN